MNNHHAYHVEFPGQEPEFDSFEAAAQAVGQENQRSLDANASSERIKGHKIVDIRYGDDWVDFHLDNALILTIFLAQGEIAWRIVDAEPVGRAVSELPRTAFHVIYPMLAEGGKEYSRIWDLSGEAEELQGATLLGLSASVTCVFLGVGWGAKWNEVAVSRLRIVELNKEVLSWGLAYELEETVEGV